VSASIRRWPPAPTAAEAQAVGRSLASQIYTDGPATRGLEEILAERVGALYAVAFSSCTAALHATLAVYAPSRIYAPAWTFIGTVTGALHLGIPITFLDVDPRHHVLVESPDPQATLAVDLHGVPHDLPRDAALTDACQSIGSDLGDGPAIGTHAWSFSPTKGVSSLSGGAITTPDASLAEDLRAVRNYGMTSPVRASSAPVRLGHQWRITEIDAVLATQRLANSEPWLAKMHDAGEQLRIAAMDAGLDVQHPLSPRRTVAWHKIRVRAPGVKSVYLQQALKRLGVTSHHWGVPLHEVLGTGESLPVTETLAAESVCLSTENVPFWTWDDRELNHACENLQHVSREL
jgi:dTDP-4-amino-4,6-dideoxygalactose transaminase